jgi:hypothetical protein
VVIGGAQIPDPGSTFILVPVPGATTLKSPLSIKIFTP